MIYIYIVDDVFVELWSPLREAPGHGVHYPPQVVSLCHDRFIRHTSPPPDSTAAHTRITAASQAARMHTVRPGQYNNTLSWRRQGMDIIIARNICKSVCVFTEYAMYTHKMAGMGEAADDGCRYEGSSSAVTTASFLYQSRQSSHSCHHRRRSQAETRFQAGEGDPKRKPDSKREAIPSGNPIPSGRRSQAETRFQAGGDPKRKHDSKREAIPSGLELRATRPGRYAIHITHTMHKIRDTLYTIHNTLCTAHYAQDAR
jgi:hypothetical protein